VSENTARLSIGEFSRVTWLSPKALRLYERRGLLLPDSVEPLVEYYRAAAGEHPDWDEYRAAMLRQGKSLIRVTPLRWGPAATGGFPARLAPGG
jgi:hypothetical protein